MISEIKIKDVASFKTQAFLSTDKKINLIYGLNGTGKSTLSNYLYDPSDLKFAYCNTIPSLNQTVFVYNQTFIFDNFYEANKLQGIFSLSKENKVAELKITKANQDINTLETSLISEQAAIAALKNDFAIKKQDAIDKTWRIKSDYTGGDRVLEYCLDGLKGQKDKLFAHILAVSKPPLEPQRTISDVKKEVEALTGQDAKPLTLLPKLEFTQHIIESNSLISKAIVGNDDSVVASLIEKLENSD